MLTCLLKKHKIKIPFCINTLYIPNKKIIIFFAKLNFYKILKLNVQILFNKLKKVIYISQISFNNKWTRKNKQLIHFQKTTVALIKQYILEFSTIFYKKLKLVGVGYRVFNINNFKNQILLFKLGYSHFLYFKITHNIKCVNLKTTSLFLFSKNYQNLTKIISVIHFFKKPEPYKGKGIHTDKKILLKKVKKI